jgi:Pyridoxamine 5'-phosphate oxidase
MGGDADLSPMARRVIDTNHYMTLATRDPDGRPRLSPMKYR